MAARPSTPSMLGRQTRYQNLIFFRNPTAAFFTLFFPLMIFVVFALVFGNEEIEYLGVTTAQYFAPAMAVFAAVSATYTNLAVTTAYQRDEGILKRIKGTPLPPTVYMGGKIASAIMIAVISVLIMMSIGVIFYVARRMPYNHAIWHLFVLAGGICHFLAVIWYVLPKGPVAASG